MIVTNEQIEVTTMKDSKSFDRQLRTCIMNSVHTANLQLFYEDKIKDIKIYLESANSIRGQVPEPSMKPKTYDIACMPSVDSFEYIVNGYIILLQEKINNDLYVLENICEQAQHHKLIDCPSKFINSQMDRLRALAEIKVNELKMEHKE